MIVPIPDVHIGIGVAAAILAVPLILRRVPMNHVYGIRVRKAFISERNWYAINAYGGWWMFAFGVFMAAFGVFGRPYAPPPTSLWAPVYLILPMLLLVVALVFIQRYAKKLPDK